MDFAQLSRDNMIRNPVNEPTLDWIAFIEKCLLKLGLLRDDCDNVAASCALPDAVCNMPFSSFCKSRAPDCCRMDISLWSNSKKEKNSV